MKTTTSRYGPQAFVICMLFGASALGQAETPAADALLASMQEAMVPTTEQLAQVNVSVKEIGAGGMSKSWEALVVRKRFADGPRTAVAIIAPADTAGVTLMTAPRSDGTGIGLWIYSPGERRALQFARLPIDERFLETGFDFGDLAMNVRILRDAKVLGSEAIDGRLCWKVQAKPERDLYYSHIVTWIAVDSNLPLRREYFDRAQRLWKRVSYQVATTDGVETIIRINLDDVQSGSRSEWLVQPLTNAGVAVSIDDFRPGKLGDLSARTFWPVASRQVTSATEQSSAN